MPFNENDYRQRIEDQLETEKFFLEKVFENQKPHIIDLLQSHGLNEQQSKLQYQSLFFRYKNIIEVLSLEVNPLAPSKDFFDTQFENILENFFALLRIRSPLPPAREGEEDPLELLKALLLTSYQDVKKTLQEGSSDDLKNHPDIITPLRPVHKL